MVEKILQMVVPFRHDLPMWTVVPWTKEKNRNEECGQWYLGRKKRTGMKNEECGMECSCREWNQLLRRECALFTVDSFF